jgi:hypothetical protein
MCLNTTLSNLGQPRRSSGHSCSSEGRRGHHAGGAARWNAGPATAKGSAPKATGGQIFQASHAAPKLGRNLRLVTRNTVVGSLGPDGRLKFLSARYRSASKSNVRDAGLPKSVSWRYITQTKSWLRGGTALGSGRTISRIPRQKCL